MVTWLAYWTSANIEEAERTLSWSHSCWGSKRKNLATKYAKGDTVYFTNIDENGYHSLFGKLILDKFTTSRKQCEDLIGRSLSRVPFDTYWVGKKPWRKLEDIPFRELVLTLEFASGKPLDKNYNGQAFQTPRQLTEDDINVVEDLWLSYTE